MGLLSGRVVVITGAGNGIGRAHALACAREGAHVVVNDLGGARDGTGTDEGAAAAVVREIQALGAEAVANTDSVTDKAGCARLVQAALDAWGHLDVVVNNAGILRDRTFAKMSDAEWDAVIAVHLQGTYNVCKAALPALVASGEGQGGAIINTSSYSGLIGNFGQANYGSAKAGIYALTRVLAAELRSKGVTANCVAPIAKTRMTNDLAHIEDSWSPDQISPVVVFLASPLARQVTGRVFGVQGQRIHAYEMKTNEGVEKPGPERWTPAEIAARIDDIFSFDAPTAPAGDDVISAVFRHLPAGFKASAAGGIQAIFHWVVRGGTDHTVRIQDGTCAVQQGLQGQPTCTIKASRETLEAMFTGALDPQQAFMSGKARADNPSDLMKLAGVLDFDAVGAAYRAYAGAAASPPKGGALEGGALEDRALEDGALDDAFARIPGAFQAGRAGDWGATIHFRIQGARDRTVVVAGGAARAENGLVGVPTCTFTVDRDTIVGILNQRVDAQQAFVQGKVRVDNMETATKFAMYFSFEAKDGSAPPPRAAGAPWPIGKRYDGGFAFVEPAHFEAYAAATNDDSIVYYGPDAIAPPLFHVRLFRDLMFKVASDPELGLDLLRLVHGEHDVRFHRHFRAWDLVQLRAELVAVEEKSSGLLVQTRFLASVQGDIVLEALSSYFVRSAEPGSRPSAEPTAAPDAPSYTSTWQVDPDQSARYAEASLDRNPIHLDPAVARAAGLPDVILHGLCTMAMAGRSVLKRQAFDDARALRRLSVRFARPVLNGSRLTTRARVQDDTDAGENCTHFDVIGPDGSPVITRGLALLTPQ